MTPESPFAPVCPRQSFLETLGGGTALRRLDEGLGTREPFLVVTGDPGTGKTALAHEAIARWGPRVTAACLAYTALTGAELLEEILRRFGGEPPDGASRPKLVACLEQALAGIAARGQVAMVVVDDAHHLSPELLDELRLLANMAQQANRPLEVLLLGLPALEARLDDPALVALRQRVSVRARLEPLSAGETRRYIRHRVAAAGGDGTNLFPRKTCGDIASSTRGVPREINLLAAEALRLARASGGATVEPEHVQAAAVALRGDAPVREAVEPAGADPEDAPEPTAPQIPVAKASQDPQMPVAKASQDPREWVARFVGDKGPLQIGSQAGGASKWAPLPSEPGSEGSPSAPAAEEAPAPVAAIRARRRLWGTANSHVRSRRRGGLRRTMTASMVAIVVIVAAVLVIRAGGLARSRAGRAAGVTTNSVPQKRVSSSSPGAAAPRDDQQRSAPTAHASSAATVAASPASEGAASLTPPTTGSNGRYTLDVGGYLDLQRAFDERDRMQQLTGIEGWVIPATEGGTGTHRIVLGIYRSHERAAAAAEMLASTRTLEQVTVVPLPPRKARR